MEELAKLFEAETKRRISLEVVLKTIAVSHNYSNITEIVYHFGRSKREKISAKYSL